MRVHAWASAVVGAIALSACSWFSSTPPKRVPAELTPAAASLGAHVAWHENVGKSGRYALAPAFTAGRLIAASTRGTVRAYDALTGRLVWSTDVEFAISAGVAADESIAVVGGPDGRIAALSVQDGSIRWKSALPAELLGAPVLVGDLIVMRGSDARLFGVEAASGARRWVLQRSLPALVLRSDNGLARAGDVVWAAFPGGRLLGVTANTGAVRTDSPIAFPKGTTELERIADVVGSPAVSDDQVCAASYQGRIACLNTANGTTVWARNFSAAVGPSIDARFVFGVDEASVVHAFARGTGAVMWTVDKFKYRDLSAPASWGRVVALGDYRGVVHLLGREDGAYLERLATDGDPIRATPLVFEQAGASRLAIQTSGGGLYVIALKE